MKLSIEERIMVDIMSLYTLNSFKKVLDFDNIFFNEDKFIDLVIRCQNGGVLYKLNANNLLINVPNTIKNVVSEPIHNEFGKRKFNRQSIRYHSCRFLQQRYQVYNRR